ncbi:MAG: hypothetical protein OXF72_11310 [Gammaproteobacteria bacterium]|nr:hypothetical protein [Gammaproteobacteria bacterium]MCY4200215.1 hypothetical protein [Gammaproteobacteria bacterium]MCY4278480.1 hypothetical protein [Gammaproteobacteria bacterium]MCY4323134.1 hypothetical protein [Gammaproteobacteria bacterium]
MNGHDNVSPIRQPSGEGPTNGGQAAVRERLARLEENIKGVREQMATKKDISDLKVWILGGVLSAIMVAAGIATLIVKAFF